MKNKVACFSSGRDDWKTPKALYKSLNEEFAFDFDPCPQYPPFDGLHIDDWGQRNFINPPFGNWQRWIEKGFEEFQKGKLCVFLLASRTDTKMFHEIILPYATEIRFIKGRLRFDDRNPAPFPSMVVIFNPQAGSVTQE